MPPYTIKNLKEVDDLAADRDYDLEARFARGHLDCEHLGVTYMRYGPSYRAPFGHRHGQQEEVYVVLGGSGRIRLGEETVDLSRWDAIRVAPDVVRGVEAGAQGLELLAIGSDRPEGGDTEMIPDFWPE